jgi:hypothetical protein
MVSSEKSARKIPYISYKFGSTCLLTILVSIMCDGEIKINEVICEETINTPVVILMEDSIIIKRQYHCQQTVSPSNESITIKGQYHCQETASIPVYSITVKRQYYSTTVRRPCYCVETESHSGYGITLKSQYHCQDTLSLSGDSINVVC